MPPPQPSDNTAPNPPTGLTGSTPAKTRKTATDIGYRSSHLGQSRDVVLADLGHVPQMPLDAMMEMVMPSLLSNEQIGAILEDLETRGVLAGDKWKAFDPQPSASSETESKFFNNRLPKLCQDIVDSASRVGQLPPTSTQTELKMSGSQTPFSARKNTSRPDGYYVLCGAPTAGRNSIASAEVPPEWHDVALPIEVKKRATKDSVEDVCLSC